MAASLATQYYQLGKYAPNDLTDYLVTYNDTMDKIDTGIHAAQDAADTAQAQADANLNNISALSQNLTATNKNVENLGKVQTAQEVKIAGIEEKVNEINSGDFVEITLTSSVGAVSLRGRVRALGNGVQGLFTGYLSAKTLSPSKTLVTNDYFYEFGSVAGNVLNLKTGYLKQHGNMTVFSTSGGFSISEFRTVTCFYDAEINATRFGLDASETSVNWVGGNFRATF